MENKERPFVCRGRVVIIKHQRRRRPLLLLFQRLVVVAVGACEGGNGGGGGSDKGSGVLSYGHVPVRSGDDVYHPPSPLPT